VILHIALIKAILCPKSNYVGLISEEVCYNLDGQVKTLPYRSSIDCEYEKRHIQEESCSFPSTVVPRQTWISSICCFPFVSSLTTVVFDFAYPRFLICVHTVASTQRDSYLLGRGIWNKLSSFQHCRWVCLWLHHILVFYIQCYYALFTFSEGTSNLDRIWWVLRATAVPQPPNFPQSLGLANRGVANRGVQQVCDSCCWGETGRTIE
jgi:hypothetical protein